MNKAVLGLCCIILLSLGGCSRQQSDWEKTRAANTTDAYEQFLKKYPNGEFRKQADARVKELYEERDWQKARDTDTLEAYQAFLKQYPEGKWTEEARIRVENFSLAQAPSNGSPSTDAANAQNNGAPASAAAAAPAKPKPSAPNAMKAQAPAAEAPQSGSYAIQLGAFKSSADAANRRWEHLQKSYPKLLVGLAPAVSAKKTGSGTLYRLQVAGLSGKQAHAICRSLQAKAQACAIIRPPRTRHKHP
jgi:cell division septation protein DedD